jgi:hypothetical protein
MPELFIRYNGTRELLPIPADKRENRNAITKAVVAYYIAVTGPDGLSGIDRPYEVTAGFKTVSVGTIEEAYRRLDLTDRHDLFMSFLDDLSKAPELPEAVKHILFSRREE